MPVLAALGLTPICRLPNTCRPVALWTQAQSRWSVLSRGLAYELATAGGDLANKPAIVDAQGEHSYARLQHDITKLRNSLLAQTKDHNLKEERVAYLCPNGYHYVPTQWSIWASGGIAVPLSHLHPPAEMEYFIRDSQASTLIYHPAFESTIEKLSPAVLSGLRVMNVVDALSSAQETPHIEEPKISPDQRALIIYTSGTTGKPKGVVTTHNIIATQVDILVSSWNWTVADRIHHVLPLHHVHALNCGLASGATVEMAPKFDADKVWKRWIEGPHNLTLFMAVPAMYSKLVQAYDKMSPENQARAREACSQFRLMVSGSSALPSPLFNRWREISGHVLLERYGMTEIGMALGNSASDPELRKEGSVGYPFPGVALRLHDEQGNDVTSLHDTPGELLVAGPSVFKEYWNLPEKTAEAFTDQVWFKTGDTAAQDTTDGTWRILGRNSQDILKSGGYKISALEIERELLAHPRIADVAVVGVSDDVLGQRITAIIKEKPKVEGELEQLSPLTEEIIYQFCEPRMAKYKIPRAIKVIDYDVPRNAMGKINKKDLVRRFFG
ncbi:hypothetical protein H4R33_000461 [Dimargaris cristalligena]|nr:hypothetical protein H4R33_000461 [Dimargaris cristalligena]